MAHIFVFTYFIDIPAAPPMHTQKDRLDKAGNLSSDAVKILNSKNRRRRKRQYLNNSIPGPETEKTTTTTTTPSGAISINSHTFEIYDGLLDPASNYTGFVEVIGKAIKIHNLHSKL